MLRNASAATSSLPAIRDTMRWIAQARFDRRGDLQACELERRYRLAQVLFVAFVRSARELFSSRSHTPCPDAARRANHRVGCSRDGRAIMDRDTIEDRGDLADKNSQ